MNYQDLIHDAIDVVLSREIPDDALADAVQAQACLMAGVNPQDIRENYSN